MLSTSPTLPFSSLFPILLFVFVFVFLRCHTAIMRPPSFLLALGLAISPFLSSASTHTHSDDIICHGTDCYPRIFQPSTEFQIVRDDQGIPPGLHVRLDISTGRKEAKLYDPTVDSDPALEAVQVVPGDGPVALDLESSVKSLTPVPGAQQLLVPAEADVPPLDPQEALEEATQAYGPINPPADLAVEGPLFAAATAALTASPSPQDLATHLATLADLVSDMYWGAELARAPRAVQALATLLHSPDEVHVALAAAVLAGTVRNNAPALAAVQAHDFTRAGATGWQGTVYDAVAAALCLDAAAPPPLGPRAYSRLLRLLSGLLHHPAPPNWTHLRALAGPAHFTAPNAVGPEWDRPRQELARLVVDHFAAEFTAETPAVSERRRSEAECDVLDAWLGVFMRVVGPENGSVGETRAERQAMEQGLLGMGSEAAAEIWDAQEALGRVLDAEPGRGGCGRRDQRAMGITAKDDAETMAEEARTTEEARGAGMEKARSEL